MERPRLREGTVNSEPEKIAEIKVARAVRRLFRNIQDRLMKSEEEKRKITPRELVEKEREIDIERGRALLMGEFAKFEMLDIKLDISLIINIMYQQTLLTKDETEFLLSQLQQSKGRDNFLTLSILDTLAELNLYLKEEEYFKGLGREPK